MIKILVISNYFNSLSARPEAEIFLALNKNEFQVTVLTDENTEYATKFRSSGIEVIHYVPQKKFCRKEIRFIHNILLQKKIDILQVFTGKAIINSIQAVRGLTTRLILYRGYTGNIHWYDPLAYLKYLHPRVDGIICNSESVKKTIDRNKLFLTQKNVVITKGHAPEWYEEIVAADLRQFGIRSNQYVFIATGNNRRMKGFRYLLKAVELIPSDAGIVLLIAGGDHMFMEKFRKKIRKNQDKVIFTGYRKDLLSIVAACHAFISSSIKGESFNKSVAEAVMLGKPAIITNISGNQGMVVHQRTGLVVPARHPQALAEGMLFLYQNPELAAKYGQEGKKYLAENFSFQTTVTKMEKYYKSLIIKS